MSEIHEATKPLLYVIQDENDLSSMIREHFSELFEVRTFASLGEALAQSVESPPDLILTDVRPPSGDAWKFSAKVKELRKDTAVYEISDQLDIPSMFSVILERAQIKSKTA